MSEPDIDAAEVARMVAEKAALAEADRRRKEDSAAAERARPVAPTARSRWRFGAEYHEDSDGATLVLRCYPRKCDRSDEESPFRLEARGWVLRGLGFAIVTLLGAVVDDWLLWLGLYGSLIIGLLFAHYARIVRIRITRQGHFIVYENDPRRPIGIGPVNELRMDVHDSVAYPQYASMRCRWVMAERPGVPLSFGLTGLLRADWLTVERFIKNHRLRGL